MKRFIAIPAILAAFTGILLLAPASASASVLCEANENPCSTENSMEPGFQLGGGVQIDLGIFNCTGFAFVKPINMGGESETVAAEVTFGLVGCHEGIVGCSNPSTFNSPYDAGFWGSGGNGTMGLADPVAIKFQVPCPKKTCTFTTTESIELEFTGGAPAISTAGEVPLESGEGCPTAMSVEIQTTGFVGESVFIVGGPAPPQVARLCKMNSNPCPEYNRHPIGSVIEGALEGNSVFEFLYEGKPREPVCEGGTLTAKTTETGKPLIGEVSAMSFSKCGAGVCAMQAQSLPYQAEIEETTGGNGTLAMVSGGSGPPKIEVNCGKAFKCIYKASSVSFALTGSSSTPKLAVSQTLEKDAASEAECGSSMTWKATYKLTKPTALFVT